MKVINTPIFIILFFSIFLLITGCVKQEKPSAELKSRELMNRGEQLVNEGRCNYCHTPTIETEEGTIPDPARILSGHPAESSIPEIPNVPVGSQEWLEFLSNLESTVWAGPWGLTFAANLTPDPETGIGNWSAKDFVKTMRTGRHPSIDRNIMPPMPWSDYGQLSDRDLLSIFAYLQSLKPVKNDVPDPVQLKNSN